MTAKDSDQPDAAGNERRRRWQRSRVGQVLLTLVAIVAALLIALWIERKPITAHYIDNLLSERGVRARYRIADLGLGRQRLSDVVIGDPANPDLVADWIELRTHIGLGGFTVDAVRAGRVRMHGRLEGGRLILGEIDKLLPAPSGTPFELPAISADIADARMRLQTPLGLVGLKLAGRGRLDGGFAGQLAAVSDRVTAGGCTADHVGAVMAVAVSAGAPSFTGPVRLATLECGAATVHGTGIDLSATLSRTFDRWRGDARVAVADARASGGRLTGLAGTLSFAGSAQRTTGTTTVRAAAFVVPKVKGKALGLDGSYVVASDGVSFKGSIDAGQATANASLLESLRRAAGGASGTPVGPLADRAVQALAASGRSVTARADVSASLRGGSGAVALSRLDLSSPTGARATLHDAALAYRWPHSVWQASGALSLGGGGLPAADIRFAQAEPGAPISGIATVQPYSTSNARLALTALRFTATPGGATRIMATADVSGPLGDGRIEGLTIPLDARWDGGRRFVVNPGCTSAAFRALAMSGLALHPSSFMLCSGRGAFVAVDGSAVSGGGHIASPRLAGTLGGSPITATASGATIDLAQRGFAVDGLAVRIGAPDRVTRIDMARLHGAFASGAIAGRFEGGGAQIGSVPLLLSKAAGIWRLRGGALALDGTLDVNDTDPDPRFKTLAGRNVVLTLAGNKIVATGTLVTPAKGIEVARVAIAHDLAHGSGHADLTVPGITFGTAVQPDDLTRLTFGVIADVAGTIAGEGHIRWTPDGVTSDGVFRMPGTDLAAAFGPVTGIAGEIRFTDLLALQSAPGQVATIKSINPGVPVTDGTVRYQTLAGARIQVEDGRWPFAGGSLMLEPTLLDFGEAQERRMTFRVKGMNAAQFLQQFDFKNLDATGTFDGVLPMIFDTQGGRIENGHLAVRQGGGTIAYVGEVSQKDLGTWGNLAFQALKSLKYRKLDIVMNGPLAGEMITEVRFAGIGQGEGAKRNFLISRLAKLPFVFNVRIAAPFRSLIDSAASFSDPKRLIERNLPTLLDEQNKRAAPPVVPAPLIQPPESRSVP